MTIQISEIEEAIERPFETWAHDCHGVSLAIVKSRVVSDALGGIPCRVARGFCPGVTSQHSWVVVGDDCYNPHATIVDATLWSYDTSVDGLWIAAAGTRPHIPHGGHGSIWTYGRPKLPSGPVVKLTPSKPLSEKALGFLRILGPLDAEGWGVLARAPVAGWPAAEITEAMADTPEVAARVPIDILGMLTDRNPCGAYLATEGS